MGVMATSWPTLRAPNQSGPHARWLLGQNLVSILRWAGTANSAKHPRKVLLRFESAGDGDIKNSYLGLAQHLLCTLHPLAQDKLVRCLACRLPKHPRKVSWAQLRRVRHLGYSQLVFHLRVHQLFDQAQACRTQTSSQLPHRAVLACIGINQSGGDSLLNGIQKQSPTRKPRNSFRIDRLDQRSQSCVSHSAPMAEFNSAAYFFTGGSQGGIGNAEKQTLLVAASNPSFRMTRMKSHFTCLESYALHGRTPRPNLDGAVPQHHSENMFILHSHIGLSD